MTFYCSFCADPNGSEGTNGDLKDCHCDHKYRRTLNMFIKLQICFDIIRKQQLTNQLVHKKWKCFHIKLKDVVSHRI